MARVLTALLILASLCPAFAGPTMAGRWRASGGYVVTIPSGTGSFQLVFELQGERVVHPATWVKPGLEFTWVDKQGAEHRATWQGGRPERIEDVNSSYPGSPACWYRVE